MPSNIEMEHRMSSGHRLSQPPPGDEVLITGISGYFPDCDSVYELQKKLFNKVDLITEDTRRWANAHPEIPRRSGKINQLNKFDASFFGVHYKEAHTMDPMGRILLEKTYEAVVDAGVHPYELKNKKVGVFIGGSYSESELEWCYKYAKLNEYGITGCSRSMFGCRLANWLGVTGPCFNVDTACSSSLTALDHAFVAIRNGHCDSAIVAGSQLTLHPNLSHEFQRYGPLSPDGRCKTFDNSANGYVRAEAGAVCFLQKAKDSRRVYAQLVYSKTNCDGYKDQGISYPSGEMQATLLREFYEECSVLPKSVEFIEAHGTGTKVGDLEELLAIEKIFSPGRDKPVLVGSIKSNLGHTEPAAGLCSIAKMCIAYVTGYIPPNINYKTPRENVKDLVEGRIKVVTEKHPWNRGLSTISSFGFGGANCHVLLKNYSKAKVNNGMPADRLPRLVCVSGRTESAVARILDDLESRPLDAELVRLWHAVHDQDIPGHSVRGYTLLRSSPSKAQSIARSTARCSGARRPVWFVYSGAVAQWPGMAAQLMEIPTFAAAIQKCHKELEPVGVNLVKIVTERNLTTSDNTLQSSVGLTAVQVALTDVLKAVGIEPDHFIGHGAGELVCAYADGCLSAEQTVLAAYWRGRACAETPELKGAVATVELGHEQLKALCPAEVEVCCHDGPQASVACGPAAAVRALVAQLTAAGVRARLLPGSEIAYHSRHIAAAGPTLLKHLHLVIPEPKPRSKRWVSTSVPQQYWNGTKAELSSAEYHVNNLLSPVLFEEATRLIQSNGVVVEVAAHAQLQRALRRSLHEHVVAVPLLQRDCEDTVHTLLTGLGKLYESGLNPHLDAIYPHVQFPVSVETPMMSHLVEWEHSEDWFVVKYNVQKKLNVGEREVSVSIESRNDEFVAGHVVDGRNLYPATGYLLLVWETLALTMGVLYTELSVVFENVRFQRATIVPKEGRIKFNIVIQPSGNFEILESGAAIVTGRIYAQEGVGRSFCALPPAHEASGPGVLRMRTKDFYKELRLRGYQYSGLFRGVVLCNVEGTRGRLAWLDNWVTFMDCMLQVQILSLDTRQIFVPTRIDRLSIDVPLHFASLKKKSQELTLQSLAVFVYPVAGVIRSGGVEMRGVHASAIPKKIPRGLAVLEKSEFVPNFGASKIKVEHALRVNLQLVLENIQTYKAKTVELIDEEYKKNGYEPLTETVGDILGDMPLMQAELVVLSEETVVMPQHITVKNAKTSGETNAMVFIGANVLSRPDVLQQANSILKDKSFIISREKELPNYQTYSKEYDIVTVYHTNCEYILLFRKRVKAKPVKFIKIVTQNETFPWIETLKKEFNDGQKVVLYSEGEDVNGILGLVNCLRREPGGHIVYGLIIADQSAPPFNPDLALYKDQLDKDLVLNVLKDGQWGTYRFLLLGDLETIQVNHAWVNTETIGDLSSMKWLEGPLNYDVECKDSKYPIVQVYGAAINFRDAMIAIGRVTVDSVAEGRLAQECVQGLEVVGRTNNGSRVMCLMQGRGMSNIVQVENPLIWGIPDEWTFEEAATVPVVYATVYYAFVIMGQIKAGESVLIHAGSGGVGQAAINVALHFGCEVFTTVGTPEKRAFIKRLFPALKDCNIGNSRDTSFEHMIRRQTGGKGVDIVLNSLSDDKLQASVRCLGYGGRFLEIGKYDISNNTPISIDFQSKEISLHGIALPNIFKGCSKMTTALQDLIITGIESGAVRPLTYCTFKKQEVEQAVRYIANGKHIGKLILRIRDEERNQKTVKPTKMTMEAVPRYTCTAEAVYVLVGGLGGFGLELADWLVLRGARRLLLSSRRGLVNGYQTSRIRAWESYGARVEICTLDVTSEAGCRAMLRAALALGPVRAVFNLAVVLQDAIFQNQTPEMFRTSFAPKALTTMHLDKLTTELCPDLKDFVVFSSASCGRGNAGQSNYGFSNSVMERICERRKQRGLPALAVQWGAVGDVGLVADMQDDDVQLEICGTLQQKISSCLLTLDKFLKQDAAVVSSIVVAEKRAGGVGCTSPVDVIAQIMGIKDLKTVSQQVSLADMGMDSMMSVEIKQALEREFEIFLTAQDIRTLTFSKIMEFSNQSADQSGFSVSENSGRGMVGLVALVKDFGDEELVSVPFIYMRTIACNDSENYSNVDGENPPMFMLPGLDGMASSLEPLCRGLQCKACVLQLGVEHPGEDLQAMVDRLYQMVRTILSPGAPFTLLGYSFGCQLMLELAARLESAGHESGLVFCLDGAPDFSRGLVTTLMGYKDDMELQNNLICQSIDVVAPNNNITVALKEKLVKLQTYEEKVQCATEVVLTLDTKYSPKFITKIGFVMYDRIKVTLSSKDIKKINSPIVLLRAKENPPNLVCDNDYGLEKYTHSTVAVHYLESNHLGILENKECANIINQVMLKQHQ